MSSEIKVGSKVKRRGSDGDGTVGTEVGIVVHIWRDQKTELNDAYIAFFGSDFPDGRPEKKPYILRYFVDGLELVE